MNESTPAAIPADTRAQASASVPAISTETAANNARQAELARVRELNSTVRTMVERHPAHAEAIRDLGARCAEAGDSIDVFNRSLVNDVLRTGNLTPATQDPAATTLGLGQRDVKRYSILRAIRALADHKPIDGAEREYSDEIARRLGYQPRGFFMPEDVVRDRRSGSRSLNVNPPSDGGFLVGSEVLGSELVELLRNQARVVGLGARVITGLKGDVSIPRQITGATAYWVAESGSITNSNATFGQIVARPRRLGTNVPYSKQFLAQTSLDAESFVVNDSDQSIAVEIDRCAINGAGGAEPLGILNLETATRSSSVTFGGAATWAKYLEFFSNVASQNALLGTPAYLTTPAAAVKAMSISKFTNGDEPIWTSDGRIGMFRAEWSNQFPSSPTANQVIFADFSQVLIMEWAGRDVVVDPYSAKKDGNVEVCIQRLIDIVIRRGKSIAISSDTAAA
jgi:HK97 family phage major capsid protein